jgi:hypothetical protein
MSSKIGPGVKSSLLTICETFSIELTTGSSKSSILFSSPLKYGKKTYVLGDKNNYYIYII